MFIGIFIVIFQAQASVGLAEDYWTMMMQHVRRSEVERRLVLQCDDELTVLTSGRRARSRFRSPRREKETSAIPSTEASDPS